MAFFCAFQAKAQTPFFRNFSIEEGLPSSQTFHVQQDRSGILWVATDKGVGRYNGISFRQVTSNDGLPNNSVFYLAVDHKNRIWFNHFNKRLSYFDNGSVHEYPYQNLIDSFLGTDIITSMEVDEEETLWLGLHVREIDRPNIIGITKEGRLKETGSEAGQYGLNIKKLPNGKTVVGASWINKPNTHVQVLGEQGFRLQLDEGLFEGQRHMGAIALPNNAYAIGASGKIILADSSGILKSRAIGELTNSLYQDANGDLWAGLFTGGAICLDPNTLEIKHHLIKHSVITSIWQDHEGGYWFTSHEEGLFYTSNLNIQVVSKKSGLVDYRIADIAYHNDTLWAAHAGGWLSAIHNGQLVQFGQVSKYLGHISAQSSRRILCGETGDFFFKGCTSNLHEERIMSYCLCSEYDPSSKLRWFGKTSGISVFKEGKIWKLWSRTSFPNRVEAIKFFNDTLWLGTETGLCIQSDFEEAPKAAVGNKEISKRITAIEVCHGALVVATRANGVYVRSNGAFKELNQPRLNSSIINDVHAHADTLWMGTSTGIWTLTFDHKEKAYTTKNYSLQQGLPTTDIQHIVAAKKHVWFVSHLGIGYVRQRHFSQPQSPRIWVDNILAVNSGKEIAAPYKLPYESNYIRINCEALSFNRLEQFTYKYRLLPFDTNWVESKSNKFDYNSLVPGAYQFQVVAHTPNGHLKSAVATAHFEVEKAFQHTWLFRLLILVCLCLVLYAAFRFVKTSVQQKAFKEHQLERLTNNALRLQMNPHFIYNSLNTIQSYLAKNDQANSMAYLSSFSRLMRRIFQTTAREMVSLKEELETTKLFLDLEKGRRKRAIQLRIAVDPELDTSNLWVPPLLLQPFLENAVIHGILPSEIETGSIELNIAKKETCLRFSITNNGEPIELGQAATLRHQVLSMTQHTEFNHGLLLTLARIKNFNKTHGTCNELGFEVLRTIENRTQFYFNLAMVWKKQQAQ